MAFISKKHKLCFINIPRTGAHTIRVLLDEQINAMFEGPFPNSTLSRTAREYAEITKYYKFSFVRNPYDWLVSLYSHIKANSIHPDFGTIKNKNFNEFITWLNDVGFKRPESKQNIFYRTQFDYVSVNKELAVDTIYRVEDMPDDIGTSNLNTLFMHLDLKLPRHVPVTNKSERPFSWQQVYDRSTYNMVNQMFEVDFETFKYPRYVI